MFENREKNHPHSTINRWYDIGEGFGAKSSSLKENEALLRTAGLEIPRTVRIGTSITNAILSLLSEIEPVASDDLEDFSTDPISAKIPELKNIISVALNALDHPEYVAVRSDPQGDDTGIGVYESYLLHSNDVGKMIDAVIRVVASHEVEEAKRFRHELGLDDGIGIMIQPVVGRSFDTIRDGSGVQVRTFAPAWSLTLQVGAQFEAFAVPGLGSPMDSNLWESQKCFSREGGYFMGGDVLSKYTSEIEGKGLLRFERDSAIRSISMMESTSSLLGKFRGDLINILEVLSPLGRQYLEVCLDWDGKAYAVQYGKVELSARACEPVIDSSLNNVLQGTSPIGRAHIHAGDLLFCNGIRFIDEEKILSFLSEQGVKGRSVALVPSAKDLRWLLTSPRELWGKFQNIRSLVVPTAFSDHQSPIEAHLHGALRKGGIGFCEVPIDTFLNYPEHYKGARISKDGKMVLLRSCIDLQIEEPDTARIRLYVPEHG